MFAGFHSNKDKRKNIIQMFMEDRKISEARGLVFAAQIFINVPRTGVEMNLGYMPGIKKYVIDEGIRFIVHSPYTMNGFWAAEEIDKVTRLLDRSHEIGAEGAVIHLPKREPEFVALILKRFKPTKTIFLLENHAHIGKDDAYDLPEKFNRLTELINQNCPDLNWGYCIDTAHLYTAISHTSREQGYKIETMEGAHRWLSELSEQSIQRIKWFHFNGSAHQPASNVDKHAVLTGPTDLMWGGKPIETTSIPLFVAFAKKHKIPMIMEANNDETNYIELGLDVLGKMNKLIE